MTEPKVFISYSWTDQTHQELVKHWADRLVSDGIDIILDIYDLKEGHDKYAFMEKMVTDPKVTHVLVICDKKYSEKADARESGVGTETQIISKEVYDQVEQSKFIPIVTDFDSTGEPFLPTFLKSRMWINFSSSEQENENWEQLIRLLYGKPLHVKPKKGKTPTYITSEVPLPTSEAFAKFNSLKQAILQGKSGIKSYRRDFLDACFEYADALRIRERPSGNLMSGEKVLEDVNKLKAIRDHITDWVLLESESSNNSEFTDSLIESLEKLKELKSRPPEISQWNDTYFEAHSIFVYETFLYIVAALIKTRGYELLHEIFSTHYLMPSTERYDKKFSRFDDFYGYSDTLQSVLAPQGQKLYSPAGELIKRNADRTDLPLYDLIQADLLVLLMTMIDEQDLRWFPQTYYYAGYTKEFPLFIRATQHKYFQKLSVITGIDNADKLRERVKTGYERLNVSGWYNFRFGSNFWTALNMDQLDTLR